MAPFFQPHARQLPNIDAPIGSTSGLYIFAGILISLFIAAPVLAILRRRQAQQGVDYIQRAKRAVAEAEAIQQRQVQEQGRHQAAERLRDDQLHDERHRSQELEHEVHHLQQTLRNREGELSVVQRDREAAQEEVRAAQQVHSAMLQTFQELQSEIQAKNDALKSMQLRYNHVDQENRQLIFEMGDRDT